MTPFVRTVLGDIDPTELGAVDSHDHLFLTTVVLPGEELDDEEAAAADIRSFASAGGGTLVQWTPRGLRRRLPALRRISTASGVHIVAATGRHRKVVYARQAVEPALTVDELARAFISDITERSCGLIKVGVGYATIAPDEEDALAAAARAHHTTGAPVAIHLEEGTAADLVLGSLFDKGVAPRSIVLGHLGRNPELQPIIAAAESGAWLCLDTPSPRHPLRTERLAHIIMTLIDRGHLDQLLLGADRTVASARSDPLSFGPAALLSSVVPRVAEAVDRDAVARFLVDNPARAWAFAG